MNQGSAEADLGVTDFLFFFPEKNEVNHYEGRECREESGFYKVQRMAGNCILTLGFLTVEIVLLLL